MNICPGSEKETDILVVEDSSTQAQYLARLLEEEGGYRVRIAANGAEGLRAAREASPTLVVTDIAMSEMDGFAMCQEFKKDPALRDIPMIVLTSFTSLYDVIRGLDCGADNFIRKPFDRKYLLGRIRFILANRALRSNDRIHLGMQVTLGGQTHFVTAERQQIFDLLISTCEEAIQMTGQLKEQQQRIARSCRSLEGLYKLAESLNPALSERTVADLALDRMLDFPGVLGGCIRLFGDGAQARIVAQRDFAPAGGDARHVGCSCEGQLLAEAKAAPRFVERCALLDRPHASVPLAIGGRTGGILRLLTTATTLTDDDWQVLKTAGNQIAVAMERAHLYGHMETLVQERTDAWQSEPELLSAVVNTSGALVCMADAGGVVRLFNPACEQAMGWPAEQAIGRHCWDVFPSARGHQDLHQFFQRRVANPRPMQIRGEWLARDGSIRSIVWSGTWLRKPDQSVEYFLCTGVDVTELRGAEEKLHYLSNFDALTGLPNRILLRDRVQQLREQVAGGTQVLGYLLLKPARLRLIGESLGPGAEREVLLQMAARLGQWSNADTSVARVGDRSFAIAAVRAGANELSALARQVLAVMGAPFHHGQQELHLDPCIGIAVFPNDGDDFDSLAQGAEVAMGRALSSKAERHAFYRPELNEGAEERFRFESALRRALERDELVVHYQPQASLTSGAIVGVEALVRWQHPELGLIAPDRFIGLAEETGLILPIGEWVLRRACEQSCAWQREGLHPVPVSVNLSARQFSDNIAPTVARILAETGLDPKLLELELTESASMEDPQKTFEILRRLKDMGVRLAIDDFGTGYSNLNYLKRFPVDKLKLDQSFVREITSDPDDLSISRAVIALAHGLRLEVIAEGVETAGQLALLSEHGCDEMQGYLFSRPVDGAACGRMLREGKMLDLARRLGQADLPTLLYVDDEANLLAAVRREMRHSGYRVLVAASAAEAFEILATNEVGVIVCDQRMPGISGTEFLSRVKYMYPDAVRMVLSGYIDLQSVTDAVNHGAIFKFLTKPWVEQELAEAVREAFAKYDATQGAPHGAVLA
ncbi:EAL domain-containing protein [Massilia cavernae]|nr:EAL domain-containing protein [Massilia cavernae]